MDMALDDIIDSKKKEHRPRASGSGRGGRRGGFNRNERNERNEKPQFGSYRKNENNGGVFRRERINKRSSKPYGGEEKQSEETNTDVLNDTETAWGHDLYEKVEQGEEPNVDFPQSHGNLSFATGTKISISNLDYGVTEDDLKDLFQQVGDVKKATIHYDRSGRSEGTGDVIFARKGDAEEAIKKFNGVELDKKAMKIAFIGSALSSRGDNRDSFRDKDSFRDRDNFRVSRGSRRGSSRLRVTSTRRNVIRRGGGFR